MAVQLNTELRWSELPCGRKLPCLIYLALPVQFWVFPQILKAFFDTRHFFYFYHCGAKIFLLVHSLSQSRGSIQSQLASQQKIQWLTCKEAVTVACVCVNVYHEANTHIKGKA